MKHHIYISGMVKFHVRNFFNEILKKYFVVIYQILRSYSSSRSIKSMYLVSYKNGHDAVRWSYLKCKVGSGMKHVKYPSSDE